jgi:putative serine protease PepD
VLAVVAAAALVGGGVIGTLALTGSGDPSALPVASGPAPSSPHSRTVRSLYARVSPSVVSVRVGSGSGTGFLIDSQGTVVTNAHVVQGASSARVRLDDHGPDVSADIIGSDVSTDLAVLRVPRADVAGIQPLQLADSSQVQVGDMAIAIGYPLGLDRTATAGIVSGIGREIRAPNGFQIDEVIQTDAPINPGNSGGPLLDSAGRVMGVNSQIATAGGGGSVGIGFAVPSNTVRDVVPRLLAGRTITRPFLGVSTSARVLGSGAVVATVVPGGPSDRGGVRAGDVIRTVGGRAVATPDDVASSISGRKPGDHVSIEVERGGRTMKLDVTLGTRPNRTP